jgi:hypothetical protein
LTLREEFVPFIEAVAMCAHILSVVRHLALRNPWGCQLGFGNRVAIVDGMISAARLRLGNYGQKRISMSTFATFLFNVISADSSAGGYAFSISLGDSSFVWDATLFDCVRDGFLREVNNRLDPNRRLTRTSPQLP